MRKTLTPNRNHLRKIDIFRKTGKAIKPKEWANYSISKFKVTKTSASNDGTSSGVARAVPGGRLAHPEDKNEEENK